MKPTKPITIALHVCLLAAAGCTDGAEPLRLTTADPGSALAGTYLADNGVELTFEIAFESEQTTAHVTASDLPVVDLWWLGDRLILRSRAGELAPSQPSDSVTSPENAAAFAATMELAGPLRDRFPDAERLRPVTEVLATVNASAIPYTNCQEQSGACNPYDGPNFADGCYCYYWGPYGGGQYSGQLHCWEQGAYLGWSSFHYDGQEACWEWNDSGGLWPCHLEDVVYVYDHRCY